MAAEACPLLAAAEACPLVAAAEAWPLQILCEWPRWNTSVISSGRGPVLFFSLSSESEKRWAVEGLGNMLNPLRGNVFVAFEEAGQLQWAVGGGGGRARAAAGPLHGRRVVLC